MSIDRQRNFIIFSCDACAETFESGTPDFDEAWNAAKAEGWKAQKVGNDWVHACPDCELDR